MARVLCVLRSQWYCPEMPEWNMEKYRFYVDLPGDFWESGVLLRYLRSKDVKVRRGEGGERRAAQVPEEQGRQGEDCRPLEHIACRCRRSGAAGAEPTSGAVRVRVGGEQGAMTRCCVRVHVLALRAAGHVGRRDGPVRAAAPRLHQGVPSAHRGAGARPTQQVSALHQMRVVVDVQRSASCYAFAPPLCLRAPQEGDAEERLPAVTLAGRRVLRTRQDASQRVECEVLRHVLHQAVLAACCLLRAAGTSSRGSRRTRSSTFTRRRRRWRSFAGCSRSRWTGPPARPSGSALPRARRKRCAPSALAFARLCSAQKLYTCSPLDAASLRVVHGWRTASLWPLSWRVCVSTEHALNSSGGCVDGWPLAGSLARARRRASRRACGSG